MGKYTNTRFYKKDNHDCANDGTCGQSITDFRIGDSKISFYDAYGKTIAQMPELPNGNSITYYNDLYKTAQSRNFGENTKRVEVQDVLPNQFNFEYGKLNCVIHYDNVSQLEKDQMKLDIQNAYEAYKAKFCIASNTQVTVHTYIFNNKDDYRRYGTLVPRFSGEQHLLNTSSGMTNGESVLLYKNAYTDNVLAHEFGHVFQFKLSEAKVRDLDFENDQLMANAIGLEVEEKNYKAICKQMGVDEYNDRGWMFQFKYKDTTGSIYRKDLSEEEKFQIIQRVKNSGLDEYEDRGWMLSFKYKGTLYKYHKNLSEEEKFKAIQNVKNIHKLVDEYEDHGSMFTFKYKDTTGHIYRKDLSEEEKFQIIQRVKNSGLDEYKDRGWMFTFKYKGTTYNVRYKDLSEEEKFQIIQRVKNSGLDEYEDREWMFTFKYKGITYNVRFKDFSEEEKFQFIKDIKNSYESLVSECDGLGNENTALSIYVDENKEISQIYFQNYDKKIDKRLDKTLISRSKPEEEVNENRMNPEPEEEQKGDDYTEFTGVLQFKYKGTNYNIQHKGYLLVEEEKLRLIQDIKNSHESLVSECHRLNEGPLSQNTTVVIFVDENKDIEKMCFHNPDKNIYEWLDKTLISRSKPEEKVDHTNSDAGSKEEEQIKVEEEKSNQQDTQQPSNFLSSIIFPAIKSIIDSISSLFSWLFVPKEEKSDESTQQPSAANLSLLEPDVDKLGHDIGTNNHYLSHDYNYYHSPDNLI